MAVIKASVSTSRPHSFSHLKALSLIVISVIFGHVIVYFLTLECSRFAVSLSRTHYPILTHDTCRSAMQYLLLVLLLLSSL